MVENETKRSRRMKEDGCGPRPAPNPRTCSSFSSSLVLPPLSGLRLTVSSPLASRGREEGPGQQTPALLPLIHCPGRHEQQSKGSGRASAWKLWISACRPLAFSLHAFGHPQVRPSTFWGRTGLRTCRAKIWKPEWGQHGAGV